VVVCVAVLLSICATAATAEESVNAIIRNLQNRYDETRDFTALFTQETMTRSQGAPAIANGRLYFKKPGMIRWEYSDPINNQIISDGVTLWYYIPDDRQVRVYDALEAFEQEFFLSYLFGEGNLGENFEVALADLDPEQAEEFYLIALAPKDINSTVDRILLLVSKETYNIHQLNTYDILGNVTRIAFDEIEVNSGLKDSLFHFIVPSGVETIKIESELAGPPEIEVEVEIIERNE
jgi:outer membrane lipoprotein carrier protein